MVSRGPELPETTLPSWVLQLLPHFPYEHLTSLWFFVTISKLALIRYG